MKYSCLGEQRGPMGRGNKSKGGWEGLTRHAQLIIYTHTETKSEFIARGGAVDVFHNKILGPGEAEDSSHKACDPLDLDPK